MDKKESIVAEMVEPARVQTKCRKGEEKGKSAVKKTLGGGEKNSISCLGLHGEGKLRGEGSKDIDQFAKMKKKKSKVGKSDPSTNFESEKNHLERRLAEMAEKRGKRVRLASRR